MNETCSVALLHDPPNIQIRSDERRIDLFFFCMGALESQSHLWCHVYLNIEMCDHCFDPGILFENINLNQGICRYNSPTNVTNFFFIFLNFCCVFVWKTIVCSSRRTLFLSIPIILRFNLALKLIKLNQAGVAANHNTYTHLI